MLEICCGSYEDALNAYRGGAERIELNSALHLGGLTPTAACLSLVLRDTKVKVICMVRPRGAGFCYTPDEKTQMFAEAEELLSRGSHGIAFGFLTENAEIDVKETEKMVKLIHQYGGEAVFHRAFDCVSNPHESIETLIELGVDRVLTSGLAEKAMGGKDLIRALQEKYGSRIELLAGSGVNASNVRELMEYTGVSQAHSSCKDWQTDPTTSGEQVSYAFAAAPHENCYDVVSQELVAKLKEVLA
ncbi:copper homeostasis protein CutC [Agathobaculum sp. Marseille-P7918]|uniref:copper homeostasis protein CutC n=1 Tax=Agathobaculum sp. Marseille-P7918 TaxID=2479843 RepID=UPI0035679925